MKRIKLLFTLIVTLFVLAGAISINIGCELLGLVPETESSNVQDKNIDNADLENLTESFLDNDVLFHIDEQTYLSYFPEDTKKLIYLPEELQSSIKKVITEAVKVYPLGFVPQHLTKLYIIGNEIKTSSPGD